MEIGFLCRKNAKGGVVFYTTRPAVIFTTIVMQGV